MLAWGRAGVIISCGHVLGQGALGIIMLSLKAGSAHRDSSGPGATEVGAGGGVEGEEKIVFSSSPRSQSCSMRSFGYITEIISIHS